MAKKSTPIKKKASAKKKAAKKRAPRTSRAPKVTGNFVLSLELNGQVFQSAGATALEAFQNLSMPVQMIKTKVILRLQHGKLQAEQVVFGLQVKRILAGRTAREIWAKRIEARLK